MTQDDDLAFCSVASKNHLAYARALTRSVRRHHPAARIFVLLVDRIDGRFSPQDEPFTLVELADLGIPDLPRFCFQYNILELNCAVKPYLIRFLVQRHGMAKLIYLDSDVLVLAPLTAASDLLEHHSLLLTPHLLAGQDDDGRKPGERDVLIAGTFNAGFLGLRNDRNLEVFVDWWARRLYTLCLADPAAGLFVDQRWLNIVPGLIEGVHVLRHPGYNVGYWCFSNREIALRGDTLFVNGSPAVTFHFSGYDFDRPEHISRHQDRFTLEDLPAIEHVYDEYRRQVLETGHLVTRTWQYGFGQFDNGVPIPPEARRFYWRLGDGVQRFGDPFATGSRHSFWEWLNEEAHEGSGISRFWYEVYLGRPDIRRAFPDPFGPDRHAFLAWALNHGRAEHHIDDAFRLPPDAGDLKTAAVSALPATADTTVPGVNVIGHAMSEKGVGEALRATVRAIAAAAVPHAVVDVTDPGSRNRDRSVLGVLDHNPYPVNILHVTAEGLPILVNMRGADFLRDRYNIGFWMWELPELPPVFHGSFAYLDEVWVPSSYCLEAITRVSPIPVVRIPLALPPERLTTLPLGRAHFGLPDDAVIFLFMFDVQSIVQRKNPFGLIEAFRRAFPGTESVRLVIKAAHGSERLRQALRDAGGDTRLVVMDQILDRPELNSLIDASDCYASLHRSEGFGVTLAEAMALGKPVIATDYSANLDFMHAGNGLLVRYELVPLDQDYGPYPKGSLWADPDVDHASQLMRFVYEHRDRAAEIGQQARRDIWSLLSPDAVGGRIAQRLRIVAQRMEQPSAGLFR